VIRGMTSVVNTLVAVTTTTTMPIANPTMRSGLLTSEPVLSRPPTGAISASQAGPVKPHDGRSDHPIEGNSGEPGQPPLVEETLHLAFLVGHPPTCLFGRRVSPPPVTPGS